MKAAPKFDVDLGRAVANAEKLVQRFGCEPQIAWDIFPSLILKCSVYRMVHVDKERKWKYRAFRLMVRQFFPSYIELNSGMNHHRPRSLLYVTVLFWNEITGPDLKHYRN